MAEISWQQTDVYYYVTSYIGRHTHFRHPGSKPWGVDHEDDLQYIFHLPIIGPQIGLDDPEHATVERMTRLFANFISNG